ncbi:MAG: hypothetical protein KDK08_05925 [Rhizobiaceae bacterium]|nr:hypothetical protein [Rhizobiaceae bacterium]
MARRPIEHGPPFIWVFGSNLAGRHGKGAALVAIQRHGAIYGQGEGLQGNSYGIPTKDENLKPRLLDDIFWSVELFKSVAAEMPERTFWVTRVGCGLAGFADWQMAPMFWGCPKNCILPDEWTVPANVEMIQRHIALYA